ncbi:rhamnan synthesis F family protein [Pantoea sp.]|uniref:rhamnan synthesis F family protein n=1 Tax=Pantoea sp. TaxID=69393 RepID=UPI00289F064C|nr:rhamnan synthesis F family protein [Pantoea sp.]
MKGLVRNFYNFTFKASLFSYYWMLSCREKRKTKAYQDIVISEPFAGGNVIVMALYEKTKLRDDTIALLEEARKKNIFVIAVNTLKLTKENYRPDLTNVYIERDNFGRDFGSYKVGMQYLFREKIADTCKRLLIINDSVFFSKKGLSKFLDDLFGTDIDVLGATENREISHHLGSFCISVSGEITRHAKFEKYWNDYKPSNVRPLVIKRGEFTLSKVLKSLASDESNFAALYDVNLFEKALSNDSYLFRNYYKFRREGERAYWTHQYLIQYFENDYILKSFYQAYVDDKKAKEKRSVYLKNEPKKENVVNFVDFASFLASVKYEELPHGEQLKERLMAIYLDDFTRGSQIHNNCIALHYIGMPIIKLDLIYRSVCNFNDLLKIKDQLDPTQRDAFMAMLTSRLSGEKFLFGLNRKAFDCGIL